MLIDFLAIVVYRQMPANVNKVGVETLTDSLRIIYIFTTNKQLRRKAIDFIMLHDRIYTRPRVFYNTIIEKIKVIFSSSDSNYIIKSISEYNIALFMQVSRITDKYS